MRAGVERRPAVECVGPVGESHRLLGSQHPDGERDRRAPANGQPETERQQAAGAEHEQKGPVVGAPNERRERERDADEDGAGSRG